MGGLKVNKLYVVKWHEVWNQEIFGNCSAACSPLSLTQGMILFSQPSNFASKESKFLSKFNQISQIQPISKGLFCLNVSNGAISLHHLKVGLRI